MNLFLISRESIMRIYLSITLLSILLAGCNRNNDHPCVNNNGMGNHILIPSFNFVSIEKSNNISHPNELIFTWDGKAKGIDYTICQKDPTIPNECNPVHKIHSQNTTPVIFKNLIAQTDKPFFILAQKKGAKEVKSNELSISITDLNSLIQHVKASNSETNDSFGHTVALSKDGNTLAVSSIHEASNSITDPNNESAPGSGAVYVYKKIENKWVPQAYLKASNPSIDDQFGFSLSLNENGTRLAVGAIGEASDSKGVIIGTENLPSDNENAPQSGAVYLFKFDKKWTQEAFFKASNSETGDLFGYSVSLDHKANTLAVGARNESSGDATDELNNLKQYSGAAYVFRLKNNTWAQEQYLKALNMGNNDNFGYAIQLTGNGNKLAVGAPGEGSSQHLIVNDDDLKPESGAVYLFDFKVNGWQQNAYLKASTIDEYDFFGSAVALSSDGKTLVSGAKKEGSSATGINGNEQNDPYGELSGAAYIFKEISPDNWKQEAYIKASNTKLGDNFGHSVSLSHDGNRLSVGAYAESSDAKGLLAIPLNYNMNHSGAVYSFHFENNLWEQEAYIKAPNAHIDAYFGSSVSFGDNGNVLAVGAPGESSNSINIGGNQDDLSKKASGAAYLF